MVYIGCAGKNGHKSKPGYRRPQMRKIVKTFLISDIISFGSLEDVVFMLQVNLRDRGLISPLSLTALLKFLFYNLVIFITLPRMINTLIVNLNYLPSHCKLIAMRHWTTRWARRNNWAWSRTIHRSGIQIKLIDKFWSLRYRQTPAKRSGFFGQYCTNYIVKSKGRKN